ncbi:putative ig-like, plexins, transcription factors [Lyophyllum shimeji]|uniref:Ig-like, plexins, transcription factors n=1 Tax=Lyophyllum shimeji TaxID=47721 RepID=A0A9P3UNB4_LYOSH|nr:putative ig-like, plexins, transcription factors [Lyophyllum shimeji]
MESSSSSATAAGSRSSSPSTPEAFDSLDPIAIHSDFELSHSWYLSAAQQHKPLGTHAPWDMNTSEFVTPRKAEDDPMLHLDELIEQHAYDDSPASNLNSPLAYPSPRPKSSHVEPLPPIDPVAPNFRPGSLLISSRNGPTSVTKPIPPPASLPRKQDPSSMNQRVVRPPKESCYNLPIMVPSIPEGGTKSRVETQVRVTVDLADASSSSDPYKYDRVGSWKWLKLPPGTATKKRTRKQGKIDPEPQDILHLTATVTCASPPHNRVLSCSSCQAREAKRVAKKLAARVRPARSDTDSGDDPSSNRPSKSKQVEDTTSIIQFNCAEILDFSTGSVVLPLRITCYCRHHREKVGFNVHFTMMDHLGRIVGTGSSRPIMITDDHKTAPSSNATRQTEFTNGFMNVDPDWSQMAGTVNEISPDARAPSKRKQESSTRRPKPYDSSGKPNRTSREGSVASAASPSTGLSSLPMTRSPTPSTVVQQLLALDPTPLQPLPQLQYSSHGSETSSPDTLATPLDRSPDINLPDPQRQHDMAHAPSPLSLHPVPSVVMPAHPHPMPFMFFDGQQTQSNMPMQVPIIHRLIPNMGPTHGGIEVTVLGANFHPSLQLNCIFGDVAASSTQRWSDNTLVCVLPPRATAGVVAVWFEGFPKTAEQTNAPPSLFTYADESDRALMELALQVVGLKMTGKIEDAKNVAMRIVGGSDTSSSQNGGNNTNMMQLASSTSSARDLRPLLLSRAGESENFEDVLIDFLKVLDTPLDHQAPNSISTRKAISYPTSSGQTLLHLAAFLGFPSLAAFLVKHGIDLDARDSNGYTALHFAALSKSEACAIVLLDAGADKDIVNALGKTPGECAHDMIAIFGDVITESDQSSSDEEAQWGDAEEDSETPVRRVPVKRLSRRNMRRAGTSGRNTPMVPRSAEVSRAATPPPPLPEASDKKGEEKRPGPDGVDAKQTAWFIEMIQRTLAQLPAPQGIIPNMPQLPLPQLPHLPQLPGMPAVPWGALPQIPMVFPVYVPMMPGWPAFLGGENQGNKDHETESNESAKGMGAGAIRTAQELRAMWEKWFALAVATARQNQAREEEMPPPVYTPRAAEPSTTVSDAPAVPGEDEREEVSTSGVARSSSTADIRPIGYNMGPVPDQEVNAFGYRPSAKQTQKFQKKHDKMLLIFWLPILFMSMVWAIHSGLQFTFQALKTALPVKAPSFN